MSSEATALIQHATAIHLQTEENDPRQARIELLELVEKFNQLLDALGSAAFKNIGLTQGNIIALAEGGTLPQGIIPAAGANIPTATILDFFANTAPDGWVSASGQGIQIANGVEYFPLFQYLFNAAVDENNPLPLFQTQQELENAKTQEDAQQAWENNLVVPLPDLRGRTRIASKNETGEGQKLVGQKLGEEEVQLQKRHLPNEQLSIFRHKLPNAGSRYKRFLVSEAERTASYTKAYDLQTKTEAMGEGISHPNMQPSFVVLTCMKL